MRSIIFDHTRICFLGWLMLCVSLGVRIFAPDSLVGFFLCCIAVGIGVGGGVISIVEDSSPSEHVFLWGIAVMGLFVAMYPDSIIMWVKAAAVVTVILLGVYVSKRFNMLDDVPGDGGVDFSVLVEDSKQ